MEILKQILTQIKIIKTITRIEYNNNDNNNDTSNKNKRSDNNEKNNNYVIRLLCVEPINSKKDRN